MLDVLLGVLLAAGSARPDVDPTERCRAEWAVPPAEDLQVERRGGETWRRAKTQEGEFVVVADERCRWLSAEVKNWSVSFARRGEPHLRWADLDEVERTWGLRLLAADLGQLDEATFEAALARLQAPEAAVPAPRVQVSGLVSGRPTHTSRRLFPSALQDVLVPASRLTWRPASSGLQWAIEEAPARITSPLVMMRTPGDTGRQWVAVYARQEHQTLVFERPRSFAHGLSARALHVAGEDAVLMGVDTPQCDASLVDLRRARVWQLPGACRTRHGLDSVVMSDDGVTRTVMLESGDGLSLNYAALLSSAAEPTRIGRAELLERLARDQDLRALATAAFLTTGSQLDPDAMAAWTHVRGWTPGTGGLVRKAPLAPSVAPLAERRGGWRGELPEVPRSVAQASGMCALCLWSRSDVIDAAQHEPAAWLGTLGEQALILVPAPSRDGVAELAQLELVPLSSLWSLDRSAAAEQLLEEARQMLLPAALWRLRVTRTPDAEDLEPEDAFRFVAWLVSQPKGVVRQARPEVCALESVLLEGRPHETFLDALELSEVGLARTQWQHLCN